MLRLGEYLAGPCDITSLAVCHCLGTGQFIASMRRNSIGTIPIVPVSNLPHARRYESRPSLGASQEFGQKTAAHSEQSFHFFAFSPGFVKFVPSEKVVSMYVLLPGLGI